MSALNNVLNQVGQALTKPKPQRKPRKKTQVNVTVNQPPKQQRRNKPRKARKGRSKKASGNDEYSLSRAIGNKQNRSMESRSKTVTGNDWIGSVEIADLEAGTILLEFLVEPLAVARIAREASTMQRIVWETFSLGIKSRCGTNLNGGYIAAFNADPDDSLKDVDDRVKYLSANLDYKSTNFFGGETVGSTCPRELLWTNKSQIPKTEGSSEMRLYSPGKYYVVVETPANGNDAVGATLSFYFNYRVTLYQETLTPVPKSKVQSTYTIPKEGVDGKGATLGTSPGDEEQVRMRALDPNGKPIGADFNLPSAIIGTVGDWIADTAATFQYRSPVVPDGFLGDFLARGFGINDPGATKWSQAVPIGRKGERVPTGSNYASLSELFPIGTTFVHSLLNPTTLEYEPILREDDTSGVIKLPSGLLKSAVLVQPDDYKRHHKLRAESDIVERLRGLSLLERELARPNEKELDNYLSRFDNVQHLHCPSCGGKKCTRSLGEGWGYCYRCYIDFDVVSGLVRYQ